MKSSRNRGLPVSESPRLIDVRAPRFAAGLTSVLLALALTLALVETTPIGATTLVQRISEPGFIALAGVSILFVWGVLSPTTAPFGVLFRRTIAPQLKAPTEFEDVRPPRFAQAVGFTVTAIGLALHIVGVPGALAVAAAAAFLAAFLNAAFGVCLGCLLYLALARTTRARV